MGHIYFSMEHSLTRSHILVKSPYYPAWIEDARKLNGKFSDGIWKFDARDEERIKEICVEHYGEDGTPTEYVTLELDLDYYSIGRGSEDYFAGRQILKRFERDRPVKLGEGVVITVGGFYSSGGSKKSPAIGSPHNNSRLEVRDVPIRLAKRCANYRGVKIVKSPAPKLEPLEEDASYYEGPVVTPEDRSYEGKFFRVNSDNRVPTTEEASRMFAAIDEGRFQRECRERELHEKEEGRSKVKASSGALNFCEFTAAHLLINELNTQIEQNLASIESGDVSQDSGVIAQIVEDLDTTKELANKLILAISLAGDKIPGLKCGNCYACLEEKEETGEAN